MQANLRSVLSQVSRGGRDVGSRRNFASYLGNSGKYLLFPSLCPRTCISDCSSNCPEMKGGSRRRVTRQIKEKIHLFRKSMTYGYCAVMSWGERLSCFAFYWDFNLITKIVIAFFVLFFFHSNYPDVWTPSNGRDRFGWKIWFGNAFFFFWKLWEIKIWNWSIRKG